MKVPNVEIKLRTNAEARKLSAPKYPKVRQTTMRLAKIDGGKIPSEIVLIDSDCVSIESSLAVSCYNADGENKSGNRYSSFLPPLCTLPRGRPLACPPPLFGQSKNKRVLNSDVHAAQASRKRQYVGKSTSLDTARRNPVPLAQPWSRAEIGSRSGTGACDMSSTDASEYSIRTEGSSISSCSKNPSVTSAIAEYSRMPDERHDSMTLLSIIASHLMEDSRSSNREVDDI